MASDDKALWDMADDLLDLLNIEDANPPGLSERIADYLRPRLAERDAETRQQTLEEVSAKVETQVPEMGREVNVTSYREGIHDGVHRALRAIRALTEKGTDQ